VPPCHQDSLLHSRMFRDELFQTTKQYNFLLFIRIALTVSWVYFSFYLTCELWSYPIVMLYGTFVVILRTRYHAFKLSFYYYYRYNAANHCQWTGKVTEFCRTEEYPITHTYYQLSANMPR